GAAATLPSALPREPPTSPILPYTTLFRSREVADAYVDDLVALDPISGTHLGVRESSSRLPDLSPAGQEAVAELQRRTLARLDERSEEHTSELQSRENLVCRLLLEKKKHG